MTLTQATKLIELRRQLQRHRKYLKPGTARRDVCRGLVRSVDSLLQRNAQ